MLSGVGDTAMRLELAATALEQAWTVDTLGQQVAKLVDRKARGIRKAKPKTKIPASVKKCLQHVIGRAEDFIYQVKTAWTGAAFDLQAQVEDMPTSNLTDKLLEDLTAARARMAEMIESAETMADELATADGVIRRKMAAQAAAELEAAGEAEVEAEDEVAEDEDDGYVVVADEDEVAEDAGDDADDSVPFDTDEDVADEDEIVNIGAQRNAIAREKRQLERARDRAKKARGR